MEAAGEFLIGRAQGGLRIEFEVARHVRHHKQQVAEFLFDFRAVGPIAFRKDLFELLKLLLSLANTGPSDGQSNPTLAALLCNLTARVSAGRATGTPSSTLGPLSAPAGRGSWRSHASGMR